MADQIAEQIKRYWVVIVTVAVTAFGLGASNAVTLFKVSTLEEAMKEFLSGGARYSLQDHYRYADQQKTVDDRQNERLTILEQQFNRR